MRLFGKNPVIERLKARPQSIRKIFVQQGHPDAGYVRKKAQKWGLPVFSVPASKIQKMARNVNTQGLLVETDDFQYTDFEDLVEQALKRKETLFFLDGITDPQNFGAVLRSLACLGRFAVVIPTHRSVEVTETVLRVACGGENYLQVAKVSNLAQALDRARKSGFWAAGAVVQDGEDLATVRFSFPLALVIGSEQKGIRGTVKKHLDLAVSLPMAAPRLSLNAAQAATVFAYEAIRQHKQAASQKGRY